MYECSYCDYQSNYKFNTERHMRTQHRKESLPIAQHGVAAESKSSILPNYDLIKAVDSAHIVGKMHVKIYNKKNVQMKVGLNNKM